MAKRLHGVLTGSPIDGSNIGSTAYMHVCMVITYSKSMDQPGKVANNPARGHLSKKK